LKGGNFWQKKKKKKGWMLKLPGKKLRPKKKAGVFDFGVLKFGAFKKK